MVREKGLGIHTYNAIIAIGLFYYYYFIVIYLF